MSWRQTLFTGSLRRWVRRSGLVRILQLPMLLKRWWRRRTFSRSKSSTSQVVVHGISVRLHTPSWPEFERLMSLKDDKHLVQPLVDMAASGETMAFWDVGANLGTYSIVMAKALAGCGKVFAFEPEQRALTELQSNIELNDLNNVDVHGIALGKMEETRQFFAAPNSASGTHSLLGDSNQEGKSTEVQIVPGDLLVERGSVPQPSIVKIDVEGAEEDVIEGMTSVLSSPRCQMVLCEVHFRILEEAGREQAPRDICERLEGLGLGQQTWLDASHLLARRAGGS